MIALFAHLVASLWLLLAPLVVVAPPGAVASLAPAVRPLFASPARAVAAPRADRRPAAYAGGTMAIDSARSLR